MSEKPSNSPYTDQQIAALSARHPSRTKTMEAKMAKHTKPAKLKIVDARADHEGDITHVRFEGNTRFTSVEKAIPMADRGEIANTHVVRATDKKTHLRTNADGRKRNNLDDMAGDN